MWGSPSKGVSTTSCSACQHTDALVGKYLSKVWHLCSGAIHRAMSWTGVSHHFLSQIFNSSLFYCVVVLLLVISGCIPHTTERLSTITHTARLSEVQNYSYYMAFFNVQFFRTLIMVGVKFLEICLSFSGTQLRAENHNSYELLWHPKKPHCTVQQPYNPIWTHLLPLPILYQSQ